MIRITSDYLKKSDIALLKRFCNFVLRKMLSPSVIRKASINIRVLKNKDLDHSDDVMDLTEYGAWVNYEGVVENKKKFSVVLNAARLNRKAKKPMYRLKAILHDAAHEMVHIKQYLNNELFDYVDGKARFKGEVFHGKLDDEEVYFNSPWEIEAYGRSQGFYIMFHSKYKQEQKEKAKK
jgi:hypothetical protein